MFFNFDNLTEKRIYLVHREKVGLCIFLLDVILRKDLDRAHMHKQYGWLWEDCTFQTYPPPPLYALLKIVLVPNTDTSSALAIVSFLWFSNLHKMKIQVDCPEAGWFYPELGLHSVWDFTCFLDMLFFWFCRRAVKDKMNNYLLVWISAWMCVINWHSIQGVFLPGLSSSFTKKFIKWLLK